MSGYVKTEETENYEIGLDGEVILAACRCGACDLWPNKGLGRAHAAAWKTRHQHATETHPEPTDPRRSTT